MCRRNDLEAGSEWMSATWRALPCIAAVYSNARTSLAISVMPDLGLGTVPYAKPGMGYVRVTPYETGQGAD